MTGLRMRGACLAVALAGQPRNGPWRYAVSGHVERWSGSPLWGDDAA
jgi:hypothetical protein